MRSFGTSSGPARDARIGIVPRVNHVTSALRIGEQSESRHHWCTTQWAEWHSCESLSFGLREASYWPKIGFRSNLIVPKFQNFPGGACPRPP